MLALLIPALVATLNAGPVVASGQGDQSRNIWAAQYKDRTAVAMAAQFESESRPVYRHRADIIRLLDLKPGAAVAEIGAGSGFLSRLAALEVGPTGRVTATELDPKMVAYMNDRAKAEGISNLRAITARADAAGLEPRSMDVIVVVNTYSFFDHPEVMMRSIAAGLKPGGRLVVVDFPASGGEGTDPDAVRRTAAAAGLTFVDRSDVVPSHYALRFQKADAVHAANVVRHLYRSIPVR
jgi:ubiquinone/menaquinone biosynthesis C-methylase UbiE